jgi:peptidyl-prolyl cis-trans isomerase D
VKIDDKQEPSEADIAKNLDTTRDQLLADQREQMFAVFVTDLVNRYQKQGLIRVNRQPQLPQGFPS